MSQPSRPNPDPLNREIEAALEGMSLQDLDASPTTSSAKGGGRSGRNENGLWRGTVVGIHGDDVIVELGPRAQGVCAKSQFDDVPEVGQRFEFSAHGQEDGLWLLSRKEAKTLAAWDQVEVGARVQAKVTGQNTGGLELKIGPLSAFMPASQTALSREENLAQYIGQNLECLVLEIDREKKRVLLSRRAILEEERESARKQSMGSLVEGAILRGKVTRIEPFGAFVDIGGGVEGLLHVSNLSRRRVQDPNEVLHKGQEVQVKILEIKEGGKRIGLGMKQLEADPWHDAAARFGPDQVVTGRVTRVAEFGAFVELEPGLEGLLHVSQLSKDRVRRAQDVLKPNQEVTVRVQSIEPARQRISLSRLDSRGAVLGSDEAVESSVIEEALSKTEPRELGTNLGNLFKRLRPSSDQRPQ